MNERATRPHQAADPPATTLGPEPARRTPSAGTASAPCAPGAKGRTRWEADIRHPVSPGFLALRPSAPLATRPDGDEERRRLPCGWWTRRRRPTRDRPPHAKRRPGRSRRPAPGKGAAPRRVPPHRAGYAAISKAAISTDADFRDTLAAGDAGAS